VPLTNALPRYNGSVTYRRWLGLPVRRHVLPSSTWHDSSRRPDVDTASGRSNKSLKLRLRGELTRRSAMAEKHMELIGLIALALAAIATEALAQNAPSAPRQLPEIAVSPALPSGLLSGESTGSNPLTGLPCSGGGASAVSGVGGLGDTTTPPQGDDSDADQLPTFNSVFGTTSTTLGSC
jgi:hypothetical protein